MCVCICECESILCVSAVNCAPRCARAGQRTTFRRFFLPIWLSGIELRSLDTHKCFRLLSDLASPTVSRTV